MLKLPRLFPALVFLFVSHLSFAQTNDVEQKGFPVDGVFQGGDVDTVNVQNGNLHIVIPLETLKQRGGSSVSYSLVYDTMSWEKLWIPNTCSTPRCQIAGFYDVEMLDVNSSWRFVQSPNWGVDFTQTTATCPYTGIQYDQYTNWSVTDAQGTSHPLNLRKEVGATCLGQTLSGPTLDGSGYTYDITTDTFTAKSGTILSYPVTDANGNQIGLDAVAAPARTL